MPEPHLLGNCRACGYPLLRLPEPRCPECGRTFDPADPATMDFNRPRWIRFLQKPNTRGTWLPATIAGIYLLAILAAAVFWRRSVMLAALSVPAIGVMLATFFLVSGRARLARNLKQYTRDRTRKHR